jgi:pimeloyl-ACP methyl ester carboxylesterase
VRGCETLTLRHGALAFTAYAAGAGPLVLLVHGFPDLPETWEPQLRALADAGYRAVAVTCRGYEPGSQPADHDYQLTALADDVSAWLDSLGVERAHLVGHDWGASIAYAAAARYPGRFASLCTMAVPHTGRFATAMAKSARQLWLSRYIVMFQIQGLAERKLAAKDFAYVDTLWRRWSSDWDYDKALTRSVRDRFAQPGVMAAVLAYYRQGTDGKTVQGRLARQLSRQPVPVPTLALHGERDGCIDPAVFRQSLLPEDFPGGLEIITLKDCGHFLQREQPERTNRLLLDWLARHALEVDSRG